jgi:DNA-binding transcriptional ArsR family regulator
VATELELVLTTVNLDTLARVATALATPTRRLVLVTLLDGPGYPAEMAAALGVTRTNLSNHLTRLRDCGVVTTATEGRRVRYQLANSALRDALRLLAAITLPHDCET